MELIRFKKYHETPEKCYKCEQLLYDYCDKCGDWNGVACPECGEDLYIIEAFIVFTTDKYDGVHRCSSHTATLILNGNSFASIHISQDESDEGGDIAYLQLGYIGAEHQTKEIADIIAEFARWARFDWANPDKKSELPTLVRLLGFIDHKDMAFPYNLEKFIALNDATKINADHLLNDFTSRVVGA